jgi:hypothetical protein
VHGRISKLVSVFDPGCGTPTFALGSELASRRATASMGSQAASLRTTYWRADEGSHNRALWVTRRDRGTRRPRAGARTGRGAGPGPCRDGQLDRLRRTPLPDPHPAVERRRAIATNHPRHGFRRNSRSRWRGGQHVQARRPRVWPVVSPTADVVVGWKNEAARGEGHHTLSPARAYGCEAPRDVSEFWKRCATHFLEKPTFGPE